MDAVARCGESLSVEAARTGSLRRQFAQVFGSGGGSVG